MLYLSHVMEVCHAPTTHDCWYLFFYICFCNICDAINRKHFFNISYRLKIHFQSLEAEYENTHVLIDSPVKNVRKCSDIKDLQHKSKIVSFQMHQGESPPCFPPIMGIFSLFHFLINFMFIKLILGNPHNCYPPKLPSLQWF